MTCPHCGADVPAGNRFCPQCRKRVASEGARAPLAGAAPRSAPRVGTAASGSRPPASFRRPGLVTLLAVLDLLGGVFGLAGGALILFGGLMGSDAGPDSGRVFMLGIGAGYGLIGAAHLAAGIGLLRLAPWGRSLQIGLSILGLLGIPCGTVISILVLVYMLKPEMKLLFSGMSPSQLAPEELAMVEGLSQGSAMIAVVVGVVVVLVGVAVVGIIAAIAIPSLLRARVSANEFAAIGDLRSMVSAQATYASVNGGHYDTPACLAQPDACIPRYPATGPTFLQVQSDTRRGYVFRFVPGPPAAVAPGSASPSSLSGWAYVAEPMTPNQTGVRAFCADESGMICAELDGRMGDVSGGHCPVDCPPLQ